jgi:hypothetical protein
MMNTRLKTGKLLPRSVWEVTQVLSKAYFLSFISTVSRLDYSLHTITEYGVDGTTPDISWDMTAVDGDGVPASVKGL